MRPIKLRMQAFGTYINCPPIDFEHGLGEDKLFLIHGATGAGKTTILDAISYALYGETSGKARDAKDMRSKGVADNINTEVEFTFALGNKIYKVLRVINYSSKRKDNKYQTQAKLFRDKIPIETKDRAVTKTIKELLGFDAEQFRQVVLLPQGEFKKFLSADSDKRQEVLNILFDSSVYKQVEDMLAERAKISADELKEPKSQCEVLEKKLQGADSSSLAKLEEELTLTLKKVAELEKIFDKAQSDFAEGKVLDSKFKNLQELITKLKNAKIEFDEAEELFVVAQAEYQKRKSEESKRKELEEKIRTLKEIQSTLSDWQKKCEELEKAKEKLSKAEKKLTDCKDNAQRYESRLNQLTNDKARLELEKILGEILKLKAELTAAQEKVSIAEKNLETAQIRLTRLQIVNNAAHLALTLKDGEPCPVCGSREHPAVIKAAIPSVSELQAAEKEVNRLTNEKSKLERAAARIEGNLHGKKRQLAEHAGTSELESAKKSFVSAEKTAFDLADCLKRIETGKDYIEKNNKALDDADTKQKLASKSVNQLEGEIQGLKKQIPEIYLTNPQQLDDDLNTTQKEFGELDTAWKAADKNHREAGNKKSAWQSALDIAQKNFDSLKGELKDKTPPDIESLEQKKNKTQNDYFEARDEVAMLKDKFDTMKKDLEELEKFRLDFIAKEKVADTWRRLSDVANATGKGESELKISFQRYYLSTMFNEVVEEANNRLKKMSNGRYLFQMKDAGKTKAKTAGLNLEIFDEQTGALRPVETLSGGESFLASLSLALGLAAVVQNNAGGIKLDTIFIDEGFGTLDAETLDFAMKTLIELQSGGRLVGIISHVEELKKQIPVRLEVTTSKTGSKAEFKRGLSRD